MTTKDWKKYEKNEWIKRHKILSINYDRKKKNWKVSLIDNRRFYNYELLKIFKTKSQALKFTKKYMRNN